MESWSVIPNLYIANTVARGRGVFTSEHIPAGTLVETSPVIVMPATERIFLDKTRLHDYIFEWGEGEPGEKSCCMAMGYVPIYNHSYKSNCEYEMDTEAELIRIRAVRDIEKGEELFINYNGDWNNEKPLWFEVT